VLAIVGNELVMSVGQWDIQMVGRKLSLRSGLGDIFLEVTMLPPDRVRVDRGIFYLNGVRIDADARGM